jgi:broad specificity phosphatase PhoE
MPKIKSSIETVIAFRHGLFELNLLSDPSLAQSTDPVLVAEARAKNTNPDAHREMDLLPEEASQAQFIQRQLSGLAIDVCFSSPTQRTLSTARIVFEGSLLENKIAIDDGLRERSRGIYSFVELEAIKNDPRYLIGRESTLGWRPVEGETLFEVAERLRPVLKKASKIATNKCVAFSTHAEIMIAMRGMPELGGMSDEQLASPLVANSSLNLRALERANFIENGQIDIYHPNDRLFRTIGMEFDTGWIDLHPE